MKKNSLQKKISENTYRLTLPFLDSNNTATEIYIIEKQGKFIVTDDGYTFDELSLNNFDFSGGRRKELIQKILNNYAVNLGKDNDLYVECNKEALAFKKHLLIQCMLKINDLTQLSQNNVKTLFNEEVENFFIKNKISFMSDIVLIGKSKLQNNFDFGIGRSENAPQRIIKVINNADLNQIRNVMFSWEDIREVRGDTQLIAIINDLVKVPTGDNITALEQYDIKTVFWSKRADSIQLLGA